MNPRQMNPRQRQGLLLVVIALVGLIGVFLLIANYVSGVQRQVGPKIRVLELTTTLAPYQPVTSQMLGEVSLPAKWAPRESVQDPNQVLGQISQVRLQAGTILQRGMLGAQPALAPGYRELAIPIDLDTGVAGQIQPGDSVDILASFSGGTSGHDSARVIVAGAKVIAVGTVAPGASSAGQSSQTASNSTMPITFELTPAQALQVEYAESFASNVRLSLVAPGTSGGSVTPAPYSPSSP